MLFPTIPPRYCNSKSDRTPGTVFSTGRYGCCTSPFCSFGEAVLYGRGVQTFKFDGIVQAFDVFDSVIDRRYESVCSSLNNC